MIAAAQTEVEVETSGELQEAYFGLSDRPQDQVVILNILRNQLYTDKVTAVLREYGCNAYDANVEVGRPDEPIQVTLPTELEPVLKIRDFGKGLDKQDIIEVFCRYGTSTKRSSNAYVGMLGIGSKSAFAYGDSFTVVSYNAGVKTTYNAYIDTSRVGKVAVLCEEPSNEPSGLEVQVPVRDSDVWEFNEKATKVYRYFRVTPVFKNAPDGFNLDRPKSVLQGKGTGWAMVQYPDGRTAGTVAIMGNIGYPVSPNAMGLNRYSYAGDTEGENIFSILCNSFEIELPIGAVEISANREGLQYSDVTKKALKAVAKKILGDLAQVATDAIAAAPTLWDAMLLYREIFQKRGGYGTKLGELVGKVTTWNGHLLNSGTVQVKAADGVATYSVAKAPVYRRRRYDLSDGVDGFIVRDGLRFIVNDRAGKRLSPNRLRTLVESPGFEMAIIITPDDYASQQLFLKDNPLLATRNWELFSTIPPFVDPNAGAGSHLYNKNKKHSTKVFAFNRRDNHPRSDNWNIVDVDLEQGEGVYVFIDKFEPTCCRAASNAYGLIKCLEQVAAAGFGSPTIIGIKASVIREKIGKKWIPLDKWIEQKIDRDLILRGNVQSYLNWKVVDELSDSWYYVRDPVKTKWLDVFAKDKTCIGDFASAIILARQKAKRWGALHELCESFGGNGKLVRDTRIEGMSPHYDLVALKLQLMTQYPLLFELDSTPFIERLSDEAVVKYREYVRAMTSFNRKARREENKKVGQNSPGCEVAAIG